MTNELAAHRARDRLPERSLAHAGRPDEAENRPLHSGLQLLHRQIVENALLHLLEVVVILIEDFLRFRDVDLLFAGAGSLVPRQRGHPFEIRSRNHVLGRSRSHFREPLQFSVALLLRLGGHSGLFDLLAKLFDFRLGIVGFAQFLLNGLHLLAQQEFTLALVDLLLHLLVNLVAQLEHFLFLRQLVDERFQALADVESFQQFLPHHGVERRKRRSDEVRQREPENRYSWLRFEDRRKAAANAPRLRGTAPARCARARSIPRRADLPDRAATSTRARRNGFSPTTSSTRMRSRPSRNATTLPLGIRTIL